MQQQVRAVEERGRVALRVTAGELHALADLELAQQGPRIRDEATADEQPCVGQQRQRAQGELESVRLRLVAAE